MPLTGDWARLRATITELASVDRQLVPELTEVGKRGAEEQYRGDFVASRDPWGEPWAARRDGSGGQPLVGPTGELAGAQAQGVRGVIRIKPPKYAMYHQLGANNMERRAVLPFSASNWDPPIQSELERAILDHFTTDD